MDQGSGSNNGSLVPLDVQQRYGFMYKKCSISKMQLSCWLSIPEFVQELDRMDSAHMSIENESVLPIMKSLYPVVGYSDGVNRRKRSALKSGIAQIERAIGVEGSN